MSRDRGKNPQINLSEKPQSDGGAGSYESHGTAFTVTNGTGNLPEGFTKYIHTPNIKQITLDGYLQDGSKVRTGIPIENVTEVSAYYWDGQPDIPILLRIKQNKKRATEYYGRFSAKSWFSSKVENMEEQEALDHQNCYINGAIPIDLTNPTDIEQFKFGKEKSNCLKNAFIEPSNKSNLPPGATNYKVCAYQLTGGKRISRLTYDGQPTNIPPYTQYGPTLNIYYWKEEPSVPLIVEFKPTQGDSTWYENAGKNLHYTSWKQILQPDVLSFYNLRGELTDDFIIKLNEINCNLNDVLQIDIRNKPGEQYCHGKTNDGHAKKVSVKPEKVKISGFGAYKHYMKYFSGSNNFHVSGFTGYLTLRGFRELPFRNATGVIVF
ncbi:hypothetical protein BEWA_023440 [Theileria equi strain WA]|uniref:Uncharacterized protein n=1 Tax=Theileria equi strain WA TaxID=1537102 RepID=L0AVC7_THEEQ|nr:hypothetical protein BEWA_023440 [Theileria equi strain WA]AFZ79495.1 hypothetical protein BEWA_023440 [Theileria equi strain WA]|eukprot:XP_004829161.1 hypothetical protein BEWA_023440 [Theileria equi strain WA]